MKLNRNAILKALTPVREWRDFVLSSKTVAQANSATPCYWYTYGIGTPAQYKAILDTTDQTGALGTSTSNVMTYNISNYSMKCIIKNTEINPGFIEVYWCETRLASYKSTTDANFDSLEEQVFYNFVTGLNNRMNATIDAQVAGAGVLWAAGDTSFNTGLPNITPYMSGMFCQNYKILKKRKYYLQPGEERTVNIKVRSHIYSYEADDATKMPAIPGKTRFLLCQQYGSLGTTALDLPGYTLSQMVWKIHLKAKVRQAQLENAGVAITSTSGTQFPAATAVLGPTQAFMDDV